LSALSEEEKEVLMRLEELEARNAQLARFEFISEGVLSEATRIERSRLAEVIISLQQRRLLIWDKSSGVRSRTGHILWALLNSESRSRTRPPLRNVADLKYIRYVKQIPRYIIELNDTATHERFNNILRYSQLEEQSGPVVSAALSVLANIYPRISQFQINSALQILQMLRQSADNSGLVLVADTGGGKSLAYQLPLILWILTKKMDAYIKGKRHVNCSALLVFPRNVLAQDQAEDLAGISGVIGAQLDRLQIPSEFKDFLRLRVKRDFGGESKDLQRRLSEVYEGDPDVIITNTEAMKRRLMNPIAHKVYREGIDLVLYDEVHLYSGLPGAFVAGLNARLSVVLPKPPVFVGMSATIANPEKHCQRLFSLQARPTKITDREDVLEKRVVEHHVAVRPRPGRPPLGVAIDATSCLLHNRRDGVSTARNASAEERPKSICFSDSLDTTARWTFDQNDVEFFEPKSDPPRDFWRGYPTFFRPAAKQDATPFFGDQCVSCHEGRDIICSHCEYYLRGVCWWFSQDSGAAGSWVRVSEGLYVPDDGIRSRRITAQEVQFERGTSIYDLYAIDRIQAGTNWINANLKGDNVIATSILEVGVDFRGIKEIVMSGEIQSPASYKQKSGRGAREGNVEDGLFVLTIVPQLPLANFYYRHFYRLVNPTLTPVPLEPSNPDAVASHAFASVMDYLAMRDFGIFNIIKIKSDERALEGEFRRALEFIRNDRATIEAHVSRFLRAIGSGNTLIASEAVNHVEKLLVDLAEDVSLDGQTRKFVTWVFVGSRDGHTMSALEEKLREEFEDLRKRVEITLAAERRVKESLSQLRKSLDELGGEYSNISNQISVE
jgi:superfamily II DNA/RNA helicase